MTSEKGAVLRTPDHRLFGSLRRLALASTFLWIPLEYTGSAMSLSSSLLRFAPLILPLVALVGTVLGLAIRLNSFPNIGNVLLAVIAIVAFVAPFFYGRGLDF